MATLQRNALRTMAKPASPEAIPTTPDRPPEGWIGTWAADGLSPRGESVSSG